MKHPGKFTFSCCIVTLKLGNTRMSVFNKTKIFTYTAEACQRLWHKNDRLCEKTKISKRVEHITNVTSKTKHIVLFADRVTIQNRYCVTDYGCALSTMAMKLKVCGLGKSDLASRPQLRNNNQLHHTATPN